MASTSALQDGAEEAAGTLLDGVGHDLSGAAFFDDVPIRHDDEVVRDIAGELHLVCDHDHGHAACSEFPHDCQDFEAHLRVESAGRFVEEHGPGVQRERAHDGDALLLTA